MVLHFSCVSSCSVSINLRNSVLNFAVFTTVFEFKIGFSGINKHSLLPWQQLSYDLNNGHFRTSPVDIYLHANLRWGQNFSFPTLFDSYRELLLVFATKFVMHGVFVQPGEGVSPMTYQCLTVYMVRTAKENGAFSDQKKFKTASKYGFHSLILTVASIQVLDSYTNVLRPSLKPQCEFVLVKRNGGQHSKLGDVLSKLVFDAIGKYSHPTCYRQIIETQRLNHVTSKEQRILSEDQKHSLASPKFTVKSRGRAKLL